MSRYLRGVSLLCFAFSGNARATEDLKETKAVSETVAVTVQSGRLFVGQIDRKTDEHTLWLKYGPRNTTLLRPIQWQYIVRAERHGDLLTQSAIMEIARNSNLRAPATRSVGARADQPSNPVAAFRDCSPETLRTRQTVRSVMVDAWLGNWDSDARYDGLVVAITPLDELGQAQKVNGTLHVTLTASKRESTNQVSHGERIGRVGRWTVAVDGDDWRVNQYLVRLPFQATDPELDTTISRYGLVHVQFVAPGHGSFNRTIDGVRIRAFSPTRDQLERNGQPRWSFE